MKRLIENGTADCIASLPHFGNNVLAERAYLFVQKLSYLQIYVSLQHTSKYIIDTHQNIIRIIQNIQIIQYLSNLCQFTTHVEIYYRYT